MRPINTKETNKPSRKGRGDELSQQEMAERRSKRGGRGSGPRGTMRGGKKGAKRGSGRKRPLAHGDLRLLILNIIKSTTILNRSIINSIFLPVTIPSWRRGLGRLTVNYQSLSISLLQGRNFNL